MWSSFPKPITPVASWEKHQSPLEGHCTKIPEKYSPNLSMSPKQENRKYDQESSKETYQLKAVWDLGEENAHYLILMKSG